MVERYAAKGLLTHTLPLRRDYQGLQYNVPTKVGWGVLGVSQALSARDFIAHVEAPAPW